MRTRRVPWLLLAPWLAASTPAQSVPSPLAWHPIPGGRWAALSVPASGRDGFTEWTPSQTGIAFTNSLPQERYLTNQILLNGSGVAAGDIDNDGRCDLFFCGIERPSVLYRNLGGGRFADITAAAGVACAGQPSCGALFGDVDGDGDLDLLVTGVGTGTRLFLNDGGGRFQEDTAAWGLRGGTGSTSMALADIDGDGYLDLYVANYRPTTWRDELDARFTASVTNGQYRILAVNGRPTTDPDLVGRYSVDPVMGILENGEAHVLYRNSGQGRFTPLSWTDGTFLDEDGQPSAVPYDWGLSAMFRDLNGDGAPDLYVCNDFHSPDRVWLNDGRGRFRAIPRLALRQTSIFSMGVDFADIDRDGHDDLFVADMLSRHHASRQVQLMDRRPVALPIGQIDNRPQYSRNTLFWNRGDGTYAEIAQYAGVEATEWTWCPLFLDVDLDGYEDLLLFTGHLRDAQNIDIARSIEARVKAGRLSKLERLQLRKLFTPLTIPNLAFRNRGDLTFAEMGSAWGFDSLRVSQGATLVDLDNDGDLDVVANCLDDGPLVLRNESVRPRLAVRLRGRPPNTRGIGATIRVTQAGLPAQSQQMLCGGHYLSGEDPVRVFAARAANELTIEVVWRGGRRSTLAGALPNRVYEVAEDAAEPAKPAAPSRPEPWFTEIGDRLRHRHQENAFDDFQRQPLLPHKLSQLGPGVSWFDLDGDGWEDLLVGTARAGRMAVFRNTGRGGFTPLAQAPFDQLLARDQTTLLAWNTPAGEPILVAGSANYEDGQTNGPVARLYDLARRTVSDRLPGQASSTGPLALADLEGDGRLALFVGGRVVPGRFPEPASSVLFRATNAMPQLDVSASQAFRPLGMVSGAVWTDLDGDGRPELVLACEAGPLRVFRYQAGQFREVGEALGLGRCRGLWNSVCAGDFDEDGRMDLVAGNWGENCRYQSHLTRPMHFYAGDPQEAGLVQVVEAYYDEELKKIVPWRDWETLSSALPFIKEKYPDFTSFSTASVSEFLGEGMARMIDLPIDTLQSMLFLNRGDRFEARPLPREAQFAPVFGLAVADLDGDGHEDIVASQNFFEVPPQVSRLDGGRGLWLRGDGRGGWTSVPGQDSGLRVYGEGRGLAVCDFDHDGRVDVAVAQNGNATQLYRNRAAQPGLRVRLRGKPGNPQGIGTVLRLQYRDGRMGPAREVHAGGGYWSQDAATQVLGPLGQAGTLLVRWPGGRTTRTPIPNGVQEIEVKDEP